MSHPPNPAGPDDRGAEPGGYGPGGYPVPTGGLPPRPPAPGGHLGRASGVEVRQESQHTGNNVTYGMTVLAFRLLEPGNPQPLDVQLRGRTLSGTVRDGDWVEVTGPPDATGRWDVTRLANLTTASTVVVTGGRRSKAATVVTLVVVGILVLFFVLLALGIAVSLASA